MKPAAGSIPISEARRRLSQWSGTVAIEEVPLAAAAGRVLAREVRAPEPVPAFPRAAMDGYAVRAADTRGASVANPVPLRLIGRVATGETPDLSVGAGEACAISTGAHLPSGADAVVMLEDTTEHPDSRVQVARATETDRHVISVGEELPAGSAVLPVGRRLAEREVAALAAFGVVRVPVFQQVRVAVLSTGSELCGVEEQPPAGRVRDVNQHALAAGVEATGARVTRGGIAPEDPVALADQLRALLREHDVVIVSGGSSVGTRDFTAEAVRAIGTDLLFHGIDVRPGRPTLAARSGEKVIFGLPGVPAAALTIFQVLLEPVLRRLQGELPRPRPQLPAQLETEISSRRGREDYVRVRLETRGDQTWACPLPGPTSLAGLARADGLIVVPESVEKLDAGAPVAVLLL